MKLSVGSKVKIRSWEWLRENFEKRNDAGVYLELSDDLILPEECSGSCGEVITVEAVYPGEFCAGGVWFTEDCVEEIITPYKGE